MNKKAMNTKQAKRQAKKQKSRAYSPRVRFRLLPVMMMVAGVSFTLRVGDFISGWQGMGSAQAQQAVTAPNASPPPMTPSTTGNSSNPPALPDPAAQTGASVSSAGASSDVASSDVAGADSGPNGVWRSASDTEVQDSSSREAIYKDLAKRRAELDKREKEIGVREALLSAAVKEMDQKTRELTTLKKQIEADLKQRDDQENARIQSLVKIYETMKPKDAATIFNSLDLDVLMVIMTKMSERKSAPILALMNTDRAKTITTMMAEQKKPPELPGMSN